VAEVHRLPAQARVRWVPGIEREVGEEPVKDIQTAIDYLRTL